MNENTEAANGQEKFRHKEYQDPHYHDDDEVAPVPDEDRRRARKSGDKDLKAELRRSSARRRVED